MELIWYSRQRFETILSLNILMKIFFKNEMVAIAMVELVWPRFNIDAGCDPLRCLARWEELKKELMKA